MHDSKHPTKDREVFSIKRLIFWLVLLAFARMAMQSILKISNGHGEEVYRTVVGIDFSYSQAGGFSLVVLLGIAAYLVYKKFSA